MGNVLNSICCGYGATIYLFFFIQFLWSKYVFHTLVPPYKFRVILTNSKTFFTFFIWIDSICQNKLFYMIDFRASLDTNLEDVLTKTWKHSEICISRRTFQIILISLSKLLTMMWKLKKKWAHVLCFIVLLFFYIN